jgi:hypothetical protein
MNNHKAPFENGWSVEEALTALYAAPAPEADFVAALEQKLLAQAQAAQPGKSVVVQPDKSVAAQSNKPVAGQSPDWRTVWANWLTLRLRPRWVTAVFFLGLALTLTLVAVGPQRAWAALQHWLGYAPGIGFVDLTDTAVLPEPITVAQAGVTLRLEQVIARPHKTSVVFNSKGLPPEDALWPDIMRDEGDYRFLLHLPDGQTLTTDMWTLRLGGGTLEFPPLPADILTVELEMGRLPLVPPGVAPETWRIPFTLQPATPALIAALYPYAYVPADAADVQGDIVIRVLEAAHTPEETAVRLQVAWANPEWKLFHFFGGRLIPILTDDTGRAYPYGRASSGGSRVQTVVRSIEETLPAPSPEQPTFDGSLYFHPISPAAQELTLVIDSLQFQIPAQAAFSLDIGPNPRIGDSWPLDLRLDVAGFPVHITAAQIVAEEIEQGPFMAPISRVALQFEFAPIPPLTAVSFGRLA